MKFKFRYIVYTFIFLLIVIPLWPSYYKLTIYPDALIREGTSHQYEIELKSHIVMRGGNPHFPWDIAKHERDESRWIYTNSNEGKIHPVDFVFTHKREGVESPYPMRYIKGYIEFLDDNLKINIQEPRYKSDFKNGNEPYQWEDSEFNGDYKIIDANNLMQ